jgi:hypothetical protein
MRRCGVISKSTDNRYRTSLGRQNQLCVEFALHPETTNIKLVARWGELGRPEINRVALSLLSPKAAGMIRLV